MFKLNIIISVTKEMNYNGKSSTGASTEYKNKQNRQRFSSLNLTAFFRAADEIKHNFHQVYWLCQSDDVKVQ